ncbi:MAG: YciI family protein [Alphaproteobacteria bacterium]
MLFHIHCVDKPGHAGVRTDNRSAHLGYIGALQDRIVAAGPTLTEDGAAMTGSVFLIDFEDRAAAEAFCAGDPYNKSGLFETVTVSRWRQVIPKE